LANVANVGQVAVDARALRDGQQSSGRPSRVVLKSSTMFVIRKCGKPLLDRDFCKLAEK
jgi:hypothetical protein